MSAPLYIPARRCPRPVARGAVPSPSPPVRSRWPAAARRPRRADGMAAAAGMAAVAAGRAEAAGTAAAASSTGRLGLGSVLGLRPGPGPGGAGGAGLLRPARPWSTRARRSTTRRAASTPRRRRTAARRARGGRADLLSAQRPERRADRGRPPRLQQLGDHAAARDERREHLPARHVRVHGRARLHGALKRLRSARSDRGRATPARPGRVTARRAHVASTQRGRRPEPRPAGAAARPGRSRQPRAVDGRDDVVDPQPRLVRRPAGHHRAHHAPSCVPVDPHARAIGVERRARRPLLATRCTTRRA